MRVIVFFFSSLPYIGSEHGAADEDDEERASSIGGEDGAPHIVEVAQDIGEHVGGDIARLHGVVQHLSLGTADVVAEEDVGHQPEEQAGAGGERESPPPTPPKGGELRCCWGYLPLGGGWEGADYLLQCQHCEQGDGELGDDEDGGDGAELVVHGDIVQPQVGPRHEVLTPCEGDAEDGGDEKRPFHRPLDDEEAEDEEEHHEGADIDGSAGARLLAPVLPEALIDGHIRLVGLGHRRLALREGLAGAALDVGDEQRPCLADAVAPGGDVAALQAAGRLVGGVEGLVCQLALAAHGLLGVLPGVEEVGGVDGEADEAAEGEDARAFSPLAPRGGPPYGPRGGFCCFAVRGLCIRVPLGGRQGGHCHCH